MLDRFPFQIVGAKWLAAKEQAYLADEPGLGKSSQVVEACDHIDARRIVVLCPASVRPTWQAQFREWSTRDRPIRLIEGRDDFAVREGVTVASYNLAEAVLRAVKPTHIDVLVLDEAHFLKNRSAGRTKIAYGRLYDSRGGLTSCARRTWRLSGTPAPLSHADLWTALRSGAPECLPKSRKTGRPMTYWQYVDRYCKLDRNGLGKVIIRGDKNTEDLKARVAPFILRRLEREVYKDLPRLWPTDWALTSKDLRLPAGSTKLAEKIVAALERNDQKALRALDVEASTLRRIVGTAKAEAIADALIEELGDRECKVAILAWHHDVFDVLERKLAAFHPARLTGREGSKLFEANANRFIQQDRCRVLLGQIKAMGTGIDGLQLAGCSDVIVAEASWNPWDNVQALKRFNRRGMRRALKARFAWLINSPDEAISRVNRQRTETFLKLFDRTTEARTLDDLLV